MSHYYGSQLLGSIACDKSACVIVLLPSRSKRKNMCLTAVPIRSKHISYTPPISNARFKIWQSMPWAYTTRRSLEDRRKKGRLPLLATLATNAALCLLSTCASSSSAIASHTPYFLDPVDSWQCMMPIARSNSQTTVSSNETLRILVWSRLRGVAPQLGAKGLLDPFQRGQNQKTTNTPVV